MSGVTPLGMRKPKPVQEALRQKKWPERVKKEKAKKPR